VDHEHLVGALRGDVDLGAVRTHRDTEVVQAERHAGGDRVGAGVDDADARGGPHVDLGAVRMDGDTDRPRQRNGGEVRVGRRVDDVDAEDVLGHVHPGPVGQYVDTTRRGGGGDRGDDGVARGGDHRDLAAEGVADVNLGAVRCDHEVLRGGQAGA